MGFRIGICYYIMNVCGWNKGGGVIEIFSEIVFFSFFYCYLIEYVGWLFLLIR